MDELIADATAKGAERLTGATPATGVLMDARMTRIMPSRLRTSANTVYPPRCSRGLRVARPIKSGIWHIDGPTVHDEAQMPFGDTKGSGYGRFGGKARIDAFTELRWITIETQSGHYPI